MFLDIHSKGATGRRLNRHSSYFLLFYFSLFYYTVGAVGKQYFNSSVCLVVDHDFFFKSLTKSKLAGVSKICCHMF